MKAKACMQRFAAVLVALAILIIAVPVTAQTIGETGSVVERTTAYYKAWQKLDGSSWSFLAPSAQENVGSKDGYLRVRKSFKSFTVTGYHFAALGLNENPMTAAMLELPENNFLAVVMVRAEACLAENGKCYRIVHQTVWSWQQPPGAKAPQWYLVSDGGKQEE